MSVHCLLASSITVVKSVVKQTIALTMFALIFSVHEHICLSLRMTVTCFFTQHGIECVSVCKPLGVMTLKDIMKRSYSPVRSVFCFYVLWNDFELPIPLLFSLQSAGVTGAWHHAQICKLWNRLWSHFVCKAEVRAEKQGDGPGLLGDDWCRTVAVEWR